MFEIYFPTVTDEDDFPCDKVKSTSRYEVNCKDGRVYSVTIKGIVAKDAREAIRLGEEELYSILGLFYLNTHRLVQPTGGHSVDEIDDSGRRHIGTVSKTIRIHVRGELLDTDLGRYQARNNNIVRSLKSYYFASRLCLQDEISEAFLGMYLTLETLVTESDLHSKHSPFTYIRNGLVHSSLSDANTKAYLLAEFGSETPDWRDGETESRLLTKYEELGTEVAHLLNSSVH